MSAHHRLVSSMGVMGAILEVERLHYIAISREAGKDTLNWIVEKWLTSLYAMHVTMKMILVVGTHTLKRSMRINVKLKIQNERAEFDGRFLFSSIWTNLRPPFSLGVLCPSGGDVPHLMGTCKRHVQPTLPFFSGECAALRRHTFCSGSATCNWVWNLPSCGSSHQACYVLTYSTHCIFQLAFLSNKENGLPFLISFGLFLNLIKTRA